jgi:hypothetical protein
LPRQRGLGDPEALGRSPLMLLFANGHEIAQVAEFHPMPPEYRTNRKDILDESLVVIL